MSDENKHDLCRRAYHLLELDRPKEAIPLFERASALDPSYSYPLCGLSSAFYDLDDYKRSLQYANRALEADAQYDWAHGRRAYALTQLGDLEGAKRSFYEAIKLDPHDVDYRIGVTSVMVAQDQLDGALDMGREIVADFPDDASAHANLGRILGVVRHWQEAAESNRRALAIDPSNTQALTNLGLNLTELGFAFDGLTLTHQVLRQDPSLEVAHSNLKSFVATAGFASIDEFLSARSSPGVREWVERKTAFKRDAEACIERGHWQHALQILNTALHLGPPDTDLLDRLCYVCNALNMHESALNYASAAIHASPRGWKGHWRKATALLAMSANAPDGVKQSTRQAARESAAEAVRLSGEDCMALSTYAEILQKVGQEKDAERICRKLVEKHPYCANSFHAIGDHYFERKDFARAEKWYLRGHERLNAASLVHAAAIAVWEQGRKQEAERYVREAIRIDPDEEAYHETLRKLNSPLVSAARLAIKVFKWD